MPDKTVRVITCPCGAIATIEWASNVGEIAERSGFMPLTTYEGGIRYLCPECAARVRELVKELYDLVGSKNPYIANLIKE